MRRGKLTNANFIFIIFVAIFTLLSFISDQWIIRKEDELRQVNIKYNNILTKIQSYNSIRSSLIGMNHRAEAILQSYLTKRNLWIKGLILAESDKEHEKIFIPERKSDYKNLLKWELIRDLVSMFRVSFTLWDEVSALSRWELDSTIQEDMIKNGKVHKKLGKIFFVFDVFDENIDDFFFKDKKLYADVLISYDLMKKDDDLKVKVFNNFKLKNWVDINRYTILLAEKLYKDAVYLDDYIDYYHKLDLDNEEILDDTFRKQKEITLFKSSLILFSILTQILALLSLLFLFKNFMKKNK